MWKVCLCALVAFASLSACRKKPDPVPNNPATADGKLRFTFQNVAGTQPLVLDSVWYQNANGDSLKISVYKYYISNIVLVKDDGTEVKEVESYHLIDQEKSESQSFTVTDLPAGTYKQVKFLIGVDSTRNVSGAQTGALDPIHGMFWDWDTGYIMAMFEGLSPQSNNPDRRIVYHTGGFRGNVNVLRNVVLDFPQPVQVKSSATPNAHIKSDAMQWFESPNTISIFEHSIIMSGTDLMKFADNYADMFTVDHID